MNQQAHGPTPTEAHRVAPGCAVDDATAIAPKLERIAITGWGTLETWPSEDERPEPSTASRWARPWKERIVAVGRLLASALGVAVDALLVLVPGT